MVERKTDRAEYEGETTRIVQRLRAKRGGLDRAGDERLSAIADALLAALPTEHATFADALEAKPDTFRPSPTQLHRMLDLALACQEHAASAHEITAWRLLGQIILENAFSGLRDVALWQAGMRTGDASAAAARRHLLRLLRTTPHLFPKERSDALAAELSMLQRGMEAPALLQPAANRARPEAKAAAIFDVVCLIEQHASSKDLKRQLVEKAANYAGVQEETVYGWIAACQASDAAALKIIREIAKGGRTPEEVAGEEEEMSTGGRQPARARPTQPPAKVLSLLRQAVLEWRRAGGAGRPTRR